MADDQPKLHRTGFAMDFIRNAGPDQLNGVRLPDLAKMVGLSTFHFCRTFHEEHGVTTKQALQSRQIEIAKSLMLAGETLKETGKKSGFSHQSHFTVVFKQIVGNTPRRWYVANRAAA